MKTGLLLFVLLLFFFTHVHFVHCDVNCSLDLISLHTLRLDALKLQKWDEVSLLNKQILQKQICMNENNNLEIKHIENEKENEVIEKKFLGKNINLNEDVVGNGEYISAMQGVWMKAGHYFMKYSTSKLEIHNGKMYLQFIAVSNRCKTDRIVLVQFNLVLNIFETKFMMEQFGSFCIFVTRISSLQGFLALFWSNGLITFHAVTLLVSNDDVKFELGRSTSYTYLEFNKNLIHFQLFYRKGDPFLWVIDDYKIQLLNLDLNVVSSKLFADKIVAITGENKLFVSTIEGLYLLELNQLNQCHIRFITSYIDESEILLSIVFVSMHRIVYGINKIGNVRWFKSDGSSSLDRLKRLSFPKSKSDFCCNMPLLSADKLSHLAFHVENYLIFVSFSDTLPPLIQFYSILLPFNPQFGFNHYLACLPVPNRLLAHLALQVSLFSFNHSYIISVLSSGNLESSSFILPYEEEEVSDFMFQSFRLPVTLFAMIGVLGFVCWSRLKRNSSMNSSASLTEAEIANFEEEIFRGLRNERSNKKYY